MNLQERLCDWENLRLAYKNASRGKRGHGATATFEMLLADHLFELQKEMIEQTYQPGGYNSFYIHEPKKRLISAAPFRDRVVHHALCNITVLYFETFGQSFSLITGGFDTTAVFFRRCIETTELSLFILLLSKIFLARAGKRSGSPFIKASRLRRVQPWTCFSL